MPSIDAATRTIHLDTFDFTYAADDFVNADSFDLGRQKAYVIHNAGFVRAIVFAGYPAYCEQDALDEAADSGKLDYLQITESELSDYQTGEDSEGYPEYEGIIHLGNAGEPFDSEGLDMFMVSASLFRFDPVILKVVEASSRDTAIETHLWKASDETEDVDAYKQVQRIIDYLREAI